MDNIVISLCDYTGVWSQPYIDAGCEVLRYDLRHGVDVRLLEAPSTSVWGIIAQPPCTHLAGSGARWWASKGQSALLEGLSVVDACLRLVAISRPTWWVLENPVGRLRRYLGKPRHIFNPCEYGGWLDPPADAYTKRTCLWGDFNIPAKKPVEPVEGSKLYGKCRKVEDRNVTPKGFAAAFYAANKPLCCAIDWNKGDKTL